MVLTYYVLKLHQNDKISRFIKNCFKALKHSLGSFHNFDLRKLFLPQPIIGKVFNNFRFCHNILLAMPGAQ